MNNNICNKLNNSHNSIRKKISRAAQIGTLALMSMTTPAYAQANKDSTKNETCVDTTAHNRAYIIPHTNTIVVGGAVVGVDPFVSVHPGTDSYKFQTETEKGFIGNDKLNFKIYTDKEFIKDVKSRINYYSNSKSEKLQGRLDRDRVILNQFIQSNYDKLQKNDADIADKLSTALNNDGILSIDEIVEISDDINASNYGRLLIPVQMYRAGGKKQITGKDGKVKEVDVQAESIPMVLEFFGSNANNTTSSPYNNKNNNNQKYSGNGNKTKEPCDPCDELNKINGRLERVEKITTHTDSLVVRIDSLTTRIDSTLKKLTIPSKPIIPHKLDSLPSEKYVGYIGGGIEYISDLQSTMGQAAAGFAVGKNKKSTIGIVASFGNPQISSVERYPNDFSDGTTVNSNTSYKLFGIGPEYGRTLSKLFRAYIGGQYNTADKTITGTVIENTKDDAGNSRTKITALPTEKSSSNYFSAHGALEIKPMKNVGLYIGVKKPFDPEFKSPHGYAGLRIHF